VGVAALADAGDELERRQAVGGLLRQTPRHAGSGGDVGGGEVVG